METGGSCRIVAFLHDRSLGVCERFGCDAFGPWLGQYRRSLARGWQLFHAWLLDVVTSLEPGAQRFVLTSPSTHNSANALSVAALADVLGEQPDLNWRNTEVEQAMLAVLCFWLERGVAGFRLDAIPHLYKDAGFRDNPPNLRWKPDDGPYRRLLDRYTSELPETHEALARMRTVTDAYPERALIGELYVPLANLVRYYGTTERPAVHLPANFALLRTPWTAAALHSAIAAYEAALPPAGWPNWVLGNHDRHRVATRVGRAQARVAAMLLLTLRGTPTIYYGDEIGMEDVPVPPELVQDPFEKNVPGIGLGRDPERTPMQWDSGHGAGFTTGTPWLPLAADAAAVNVAAQRDDPESFLGLYRRGLAVRRAGPAGAWRPRAQPPRPCSSPRTLGPGVDHAHDHRGDRGGRYHAAPVGRSMGYRGEGRVGVGPHDPRSVRGGVPVLPAVRGADMKLSRRPWFFFGIAVVFLVMLIPTPAEFRMVNFSMAALALFWAILLGLEELLAERAARKDDDTASAAEPLEGDGP